MLLIAKDRTTGKEVHISNAERGKPYECKTCEMPLFPVLGEIITQHYRCVGHHRKAACMQLSCATDIVYNIADLDIFGFLAGLRRMQLGGNGGAGVGGGGRPGGVGGSLNGEPIVKRCTTLNHIWKAGIGDLPHNAAIGQGIRSDVLIRQREFWMYLDAGIELHDRVLEVKPITPLGEMQAILFGAHWYVKSTDGIQNREELLVLEFTDKDLWLKKCQALFAGTFKADGTYTTRRCYDAVLVGGDWRICDESECKAYGLRLREACVRVRKAICISGNQIYALPKTKQ